MLKIKQKNKGETLTLRVTSNSPKGKKRKSISIQEYIQLDQVCFYIFLLYIKMITKKYKYTGKQ